MTFSDQPYHVKCEPAQTRVLMVFLFVVLLMFMCSSLFRLQTCVFCLKLPQALFSMSANSKGSGETVLMHSLARAFAGWYVISPLFSCLAHISYSTPGVNWRTHHCSSFTLHCISPTGTTILCNCTTHSTL